MECHVLPSCNSERNFGIFCLHNEVQYINIPLIFSEKGDGVECESRKCSGVLESLEHLFSCIWDSNPVSALKEYLP